jgi:hypothetical protein
MMAVIRYLLHVIRIFRLIVRNTIINVIGLVVFMQYL